MSSDNYEENGYGLNQVSANNLALIMCFISNKWASRKSKHSRLIYLNYVLVEGGYLFVVMQLEDSF